MKKNVKIMALVLTASLIVPLAACSKKTKETRKKRKTKKTTSVEETEKTKKTTQTETEEPFDDSDPPDTKAPSVPTDSVPDMLITLPEENCAIEFPTSETFRYTMDLTLDTEKNQVGGHVDIEFFNFQGIQQFAFHPGRLYIFQGQSPDILCDNSPPAAFLHA